MIKSVLNEISFVLSKKMKAKYIGWHGNNNLGDEVLFNACKLLLGEKVAIYDKKYLGKGVKTLMRGKFDLAILGGGTLINIKRYLRDFQFTEADRKILFGTGVAEPSFWAGVDGYGEDLEEWVDVLNKVDYLGVRGPMSYETLKGWGVEREIKVIGDPALVYAKDEITQKQRNKIVGISIGYARGYIWGGDENRFIAEFTDIVRGLVSDGWRIKMFPVCPLDVNVISHVIKEVSSSNISVISNYLSLDDFFLNLEGLDVFIGEKLHAVILSICSLTPSIMIEYRPKCHDFIRSLGLERLSYRADKINNVDMVEVVRELYENIDNEQKVLLDVTQKYKKILLSEVSSMLSS